MTETNRMSREIRAFVEGHRDGWNHDDWMGLIHHLGVVGCDTSDHDGIGLALEQERVKDRLRASGIKGLGPKRIEAIASAFPFLNELRTSESQEIASRSGIPGKLAQEIVERIV
jgi:hypothetical protein